MIKLENFKEHIQTLKTSDWERLFALIPKMEKTTVFGEEKGWNKLENGNLEMPFWNCSKIVDEFIHIFYDLKLCVVFDWTSWIEGRDILNQKDFDFSKLDTITLCKILTIIIRADRFNDGYLDLNFENGVIPKIIKALKLIETK
jgi:hypothetical protein